MNDLESSDIPRRVIDTNVIMRFIVGDAGDLAIAAKNLFQAATDGQVILVIPEIVFTESVQVLQFYYKVSREHIVKALQGLLSLPGIETCTAMAILLEALNQYEELDVPWGDALIAAHMSAAGMTEIYSFDKHFKRFPKLTPIRPKKVKPS